MPHVQGEVSQLHHADLGGDMQHSGVTVPNSKPLADKPTSYPSSPRFSLWKLLGFVEAMATLRGMTFLRPHEGVRVARGELVALQLVVGDEGPVDWRMDSFGPSPAWTHPSQASRRFGGDRSWPSASTAHKRASAVNRLSSVGSPVDRIGPIEEPSMRSAWDHPSYASRSSRVDQSSSAGWSC